MSVKCNRKPNTSGKPVFVTQDPAMKHLYKKVRLVARSRAPVFIAGESGTGKEVLARLLHYHSTRSNQPFVALNCGALPEDIVESELFGHEKGSFTGALDRKKGCFEQSDGGVLFLDEVGEMSPQIQVKLLRAVEQKNFRRVGGTEEVHTDVQIISATNRNITEMMSSGNFRDDLYYRLSVIELYIPPLRERPGDIPLLCEFFLNKYADEYGLPVKEFSAKSIKLLMDYNWPGNVRELCNVVERCAIMCDEKIIKSFYLPGPVGGSGMTSLNFKNGKNGHGNQKFVQIPVGTSMENAERLIINQTLSHTENNISKAARILGVSRNTLHNKLSKFGEQQ